jgi:hypothetical protein
MTPTTGVRPGFAHRHVFESYLTILQTCTPMPIDSAVEPHSVLLCTWAMRRGTT